MNKLLSKVLGGLIFVTSIISPMSAFGMEDGSSKAVMAVSNSTSNEAVYASPITPVQNSDDHGDNFETATELALNADGVGQISSSSDIDCFKFTTDVSEEAYFIEVSGTGTAILTMYNSAKQKIRSGLFYLEKNYSFIEFLPPNKTYYLEINSDESNISYKVRVNKLPDDHGLNASTATEFAINTEVCGTINYIDDRDYFKITSDTAGNYCFDCSGTGEAYLYLYDTLGRMIGNGYFTADKGCYFDSYLQANKPYYLHVTSKVSGMTYKVKMTQELLNYPLLTYGAEKWCLWTEGGAVASGTKDTTVYEPSFEKAEDLIEGSYRIDCTSKGSALNHIQLFNTGLNSGTKIKEGKKYKLSFMAKSEGGNANPVIALMQKSSPWAYYAKSSAVTIDSKWKLYNVYFTANKSDNDARLTFFLGNRMTEGSKLYIGTMSLKECSSSELLNPSFENGVEGWYLWTENGAAATGTRDIEEYDSAPAGYRIDCTSKGRAMNHIQLFTCGINVKADKRYKLTFRAKSEGGNVTPLVSLMKKNSPWTSYAASKQVSIGSDWDTYEVYFDCNTTDSDARITFFLGNKMPDGSKLYLDSMSLIEVSAYSGTSGRLFRRHPDTKPELSGHLADRFDFTVTIPKLQYCGIV